MLLKGAPEVEISLKSKNGINIYAYKNPNLHSFHLSLFLRAGAMFETAADGGITHFLEHVSIRNVNKIMNGTLYRTLDKYGLECPITHSDIPAISQSFCLR